jgi:hypothetical protein
MPVILTLEELKQDYKFKDNLGYIMRSCLPSKKENRIMEKYLHFQVSMKQYLQYVKGRNH